MDKCKPYEFGAEALLYGGGHGSMFVPDHTAIQILKKLENPNILKGQPNVEGK